MSTPNLPQSHHEHDPFSDESLKIVQAVEALPHSRAFEHLAYKNLVDRTAVYVYPHGEDSATDENPIKIDASLMASQFPEPLKGIFPSIDYTIEQLSIRQTETKRTPRSKTVHASLDINFYANGAPHSISVENGKVTYATINEHLDKVVYTTLEPAAITGLIAAFLYAQQYEPTGAEQPIELEEPAIITKRDPLTSLNEQIIMTLGDHDGRSTVTTRALFEKPDQPSLLVTLKEQEYPDKSAVATQLFVSEVLDINELTTASDTTLHQNIVNVEQGNDIIPVGKLEKRYAEQHTSILSKIALSASEYIDPVHDYARWSQTCRSLYAIIKDQLKSHAYLDEESRLN
ncbi:MAG TPA: hypothetical protein QF549_03515 [Candidatus Saccharimonadaceae bacterium]|nr:hypothetical protein [Candidatus Saccharimonadaceae bacterium]